MPPEANTLSRPKKVVHMSALTSADTPETVALKRCGQGREISSICGALSMKPRMASVEASLNGTGPPAPSRMPGAKCVAGKGCVIDRDVEGGVGVDAPARAFDFSGNLANPAAVRALEKHVFVKVREPSFVCALVRAPDFGPDLQVDDRGKMAFAQQERQAVGQDFVMYALFKRSQRGF